MNPFKTRAGRIIVTVAATLGLSLAAFAAVVSTDIGGRTAIADASATSGLSVVSAQSVAGSGGLTCSVAPNDGNAVATLTARRVVVNSERRNIPAQNCTLVVQVRNNGSTPAEVSNMFARAVDTGALTGWTFTPAENVAGRVIGPDQVEEFRAAVSTGGAAVQSVGTGRILVGVTGNDGS